MRKHVWKLRIFQDARYVSLIARCAAAMADVCGNKVGYAKKVGCVDIYCHWKHWICLFPQHGPGAKHTRSISLEQWQWSLVKEHPRELVAGLIHSDGCRVTNRVLVRGKRYEYPRYFFTNHSEGIHRIFASACRLIGVDCRPNNRWNVSVAKRESVAILDSFIGPKS